MRSLLPCEENTLLPCPLCGSSVRLHGHGISCPRCGLWLGAGGPVYDEWTRRHGQKPLPADDQRGLKAIWNDRRGPDHG